MKFRYKLNWDEDLAPSKEQLVQIQLPEAVGSRQEYRKIHHEAYLSNLCNQIWEEPVINSDGKNLGCCRNFWGDFGGNAFTDTVRGILYNEKMKYAREMLRGKATMRSDIPCSTCELYLSRLEDGNWLNLPEPIIEP